MSRLTTKPTKWHVCPVKTQISLGIHPIWSESSLSAWRNLGSLATHWAHSEDPDQMGRGRCPGWPESLLGAHAILLVMSWGSSFFSFYDNSWKVNIYYGDWFRGADQPGIGSGVPTSLGLVQGCRPAWDWFRGADQPGIVSGVPTSLGLVQGCRPAWDCSSCQL